MKTLATMVTERGQVTIPSQIRRKLHLRGGERVMWEVLSEHACKLVVELKTPAPGAEAMLGYASRFRKPRSTHEWMTELRERDET